MTHDRNWLDQWRLLFAASVLFSHSFDLLGREADEPFRKLTGLGIAGLGVCGFFVLSGYLISRSWLSQPDLAAYLRKRILRIYPAFVVAFVLSILIVGALASGTPSAYLQALNWPVLALDLVGLHQPTAPAAPPYPGVNDAMWTIRYEALCYLLAPLALYRKSLLVLAWIAVAVLAVLTTHMFPAWLLMFLSGAIYWRFQIRPRRALLILAAFVLPASLLLSPTITWAWKPGLAIAGTYLVLWAALQPRKGPAFADISYGTYLYGWPAQKLLILAGVSNPWVLVALAVPLALICGAASWYGVEKWALALKGVTHPTAKSPRAARRRMQTSESAP